MNQKNYPDPDIPADEAWTEMKQLLHTSPGNIPPRKIGKTNLLKPFVYAGTGMLIVSIVTYFLLKQKPEKQQAVITYQSQNKPIKDSLSDGTIIFLDKNSSVVEFSGTIKESAISIKGAAYFPEISNNLKPRRIRVGSLELRPTNVGLYLSYDSISEMSLVYVQSGIADLEANGEKIKLNVGEAIQYNEKTKQIELKQKVNVNKFSYATMIFEFNDTPLQEAVESIEKAYGVTIEIENKKLYACRITTRFDNKTLKEVLDVMAYTLNFEYTLDEKTKRVLISGNGCE
jgi:transmembrane sensor